MDENTAPITDGEIESGGASQSGGGDEADTTAKQAQELYDDLGIKAKVPTDSTRSKSSSVRAKDTKSKDSKSSEGGEKETSDDKSESKTAPDTTKTSDDGNKSNPKGKKDGDEDGQVHGDSEKSGKGDGEDKPEGSGDTKRGSEDDADGTDDDATRGDGEEEGDEGKRAGKSNPKIEQRFQKLTSEIKERDQKLQELQEELEKARRQQWEDNNNAEDPEYKLEDFRTVRDENGNVLDLDDDQAELAYRRWKDGYDARREERESKYSEEQEIARYAEDATRRVMQSSANAYDTLTSILDEMPELNPKSDKFDKDFSAQVMPIINDSILYQPGTEPGNEENRQSVIVGLKIDPRKVITAMNAIRTAKRAVPLNGLSDSVEDANTKTVSHSRSSDPIINQANELYKELGIKKRL